MKIKIGGRLSDSTQQLKQLKNKIMDTLNNSGTLPFTLVDGNDFTTKFTNYELLDAEYDFAKENSEIWKQKRYVNKRLLLKNSREIAQFLKVRNHTNVKKLYDWGITIVGVDDNGRVKINGGLIESEHMFKGIIDKHILDGANSILSVFDMTEFETLYNEMMTYKGNYETNKVLWRTKSVYKREQFSELLKMQRLIAKEMYTHPDYSKRDLELWGYEVLEFHNRN